MATKQGYSTLQISLHWIMALLILAAWISGDGMGRVLRARLEAGTTGIEGNTPHVWLGGAIFALILIRIIVRLIQGAPAPLGAGPDWQLKAATWAHRALYALMVLVPALGAAAWYGHVEIAGEAHEIAVNALVLLALGHAAVGIWHHHVVKDDTLRRMIRPKSH